MMMLNYHLQSVANAKRGDGKNGANSLESLSSPSIERRRTTTSQAKSAAITTIPKVECCHPHGGLWTTVDPWS